MGFYDDKLINEYKILQNFNTVEYIKNFLEANFHYPFSITSGFSKECHLSFVLAYLIEIVISKI